MEFSINSDLSENVAYNHPLFPAYVKKGLLSTYPNYSAVSHWHDDLEMNILIKGSMDFNVNGEIVKLKRGILINGRQLHFGFSKSRQECELSPFSAQESFFRIFELLYQNLSGEAVPADNEQLECMRKMIGFIQKNYCDSISLEQIARAGECCKSKCSSLFKSHLSQSPNQYLIAYRLNKSIDLLLGTTQTVTEIAFASGFRGSSYYCEAFRRHFGLSPREYRKLKK